MDPILSGFGIRKDEDSGSESDDSSTASETLYESMMERSSAARAAKKREEEVKARSESKKSFEKGSGVKKGFLKGPEPPKPPPQRPPSKLAAPPGTKVAPGALSVLLRPLEKRKEVPKSDESAAKEEDSKMPHLRARPGAPDAGLRMPEVQKAMRGVETMKEKLSSKSWMTEEFMTAIGKDPVLSAGLADPHCLAAIDEYSKDAAGAAKKYGKDSKVNRFLQAFASAMGSHLETLGEKEETSEEGSGSGSGSGGGGGSGGGEGSGGVGLVERGTRTVESEESLLEKGRGALQEMGPDKVASMVKEGEIEADDDVREVLSKQDVLRTLADPKIQKMLEDVRMHPERLPIVLRDPYYAKAIKLLQDNGLISFQ